MIVTVDKKKFTFTWVKSFSSKALTAVTVRQSPPRVALPGAP